MQHDRDRDGALSPLEMESLFSRCLFPPWGDEYKYTVATNEKVVVYIIVTSDIDRFFFIKVEEKANMLIGTMVASVKIKI